MVITSFVIQKCYLTFNTVLISAFMGRTAGSLVHRSRQWHQTVQVVMVFLHWHAVVVFKKMHLLFKNVPEKLLKITFWPLSTRL